ncbi:Uncharacterised protein [Serratia quinivorans]|uniref:glucosyl transferase GtrII family protein n=1 Tax=Serratia quinivorans TaxID=137545 RepID=UPI002179AB26|nr:glucosyl transferase GtrII family protein [Serratia quinivorans]CAI0763446.1 Uncharacterised protein [Serratia quinivorans]CAI0819683.1 Uncharacterised protein [Serratia quinivorans]CAI0849621.1 Uncharacterised protein [Serratia quinivorans]CAI0887169.1 Uncharacterised protein [Serratia quinivorans]CAI1678037.1 Uncharacterised protein [Serratia quinivorans]
MKEQNRKPSETLGNNTYLIYALIILIGFSPIIFSHYAFMDDYTTLYYSLSGEGSTFQWDVLSGRPSYAVFRFIYQGLVHNIQDFSYVRAFTIVTVFIYCSLIHSFIVNRGITKSKTVAFYLPIFLSFNPAILVFTAWATCFPFILAMIAALFSYQILTTTKVNSIFFRLILSITLIVFSFSIYQPAGLTFLFFVFLDNCITERSISYRKILTSAMIVIIGMISAYLMAKVLPAVVYGETLARASFTHDVAGKIHWFLTEALVNALNNYNIKPSLWYTLFSTLIVAFSMYLTSKSSDGYKKVLLSLILIVGSYSSNLLVSENWAAFRGLIGVELILTTYFCLGLLYIIGYIFKSREHMIPAAIIAMILLITQNNLYSGFVRQQQGEYQALSQEISSRIAKDFKGDVFFDIKNPAFNIFTKIQRYDEFGNISLATTWSPAGMALSIKKTKGLQFNVNQNNAIIDNDKCDNCIIIKTGDIMRNAGLYY